MRFIGIGLRTFCISTNIGYALPFFKNCARICLDRKTLRNGEFDRDHIAGDRYFINRRDITLIVITNRLTMIGLGALRVDNIMDIA